ncbi:MAG: class I SAM-dependent methyltransferase, partial [Candidatus Aenigmarchaeota archaeon]|nr:class I SAM-dependent methyltransferase [Candidatus Aenigmarchaeota archaeon]
KGRLGDFMARDPDLGEWRAPGFVFRTAGFFTGVRDVLRNPKKVLEDLGIKSGFSVLDFGCGPGNFTIAAAEIVGKDGEIHALDLHPLALETIEKKAERRGLKNVDTIFSDLETGLGNGSVDAALLYGVLYKTGDKRALIREMRRILKPGGLVSISGYRMSKDRLMGMMKGERFSLRDSKRGILNFTKRR